MLGLIILRFVYFLVVSLVVGTSPIDCLDRLVSEMTCYLLSGTLNPTHSLTPAKVCLSAWWHWKRIPPKLLEIKVLSYRWHSGISTHLRFVNEMNETHQYHWTPSYTLSKRFCLMLRFKSAVTTSAFATILRWLCIPKICVYYYYYYYCCCYCTMLNDTLLPLANVAL